MISEIKRKATWQELADRVDELQEKLDNSISKDKIKEKIEEIKNKEVEDRFMFITVTQGKLATIITLEELLKGE